MNNSNIPSKSMKVRVKIIMIIVFFALFSLVIGKFFKVAIIDNEKYQKKANDMHFGSITISAHRGSIYDSTGTPLAKSASVYKVFLDPKAFRSDLESLQKKIDEQNAEKLAGTYQAPTDANGMPDDNMPVSAEAFKQSAIVFLSEKLGITTEKVSEAMVADNQYSILQDQVEKPVADEVLAYFNQYGLVSLNVEEDTKRYYPQSECAAPVIGFTNADGDGLYGLEAYYNEYLSGVDGKTISAKDSNGNELPYRYSKTYPAKNGDDLYLTIDMTLQYYLEDHLQEMVNEFEVKQRGCAILMNAKTGAIYAMATYPSFDLNNPYEISDPNEASKIAQLTGDEATAAKAEAREAQWKNKCITEIYEPGSTFKIITSASAIEENVIDLERDSFYCDGAMMIDGWPRPIKCHDTGGHGSQTFYEALTHSCNPAFMQIGARLGIEKFCQYFNAFGLDEKTGIDLPGESVGISYNVDTMSNVDLATCSFGQGNTVTPMNMITAAAAAINGGYLLQPYVVEKIVDSNGNVVLKNERTVKRQVVSEDTSAKMRVALERVVTDGRGGNVTIKGYSIGGKSGTSERISQNKSDSEEPEYEYAASYICFTPADDPEIILLVMADMPNKEIGYYGSTVAVPTARDILTDALPYLGYSPQYSDEEIENLDVKIPLLEGKLENAKATLDGLGIEYVVVGEGTEVLAQSPVTGSSISKDGCVYLYTEENTSEYTEVPDFKGMTASWANETAAAYGLNFVATGASTERSDSVVSKQSKEVGEKVLKGTVIELEFIVNQNSD